MNAPVSTPSSPSPVAFDDIFHDVHSSFRRRTTMKLYISSLADMIVSHRVDPLTLLRHEACPGLALEGMKIWIDTMSA